MKFSPVALGALAISLSACATVPAAEVATAPAVEAAADPYPLTPAGAAEWVAMVEKDLSGFTVEFAQVQWINATYITHDSDTLAAKYGAIATEKTVQYANDAARYAAVAGLDPVVARKLDILRNGIVMPAP